MSSDTTTIKGYLASIPEERRVPFSRLRDCIRTSLPEGFEETMGYGMVGYVVPHSLYPAGYHCDPSLPLPFINLTSRKNHIALYHMGIYRRPDLLDWFVKSYIDEIGKKPDMGKSCIRFKKPEQIPFDLIGDLCSRINTREWISLYEAAFRMK